MRIGVALPVLGVVWKAGKAKYGDLMPGAGFFDGT